MLGEGRNGAHGDTLNEGILGIGKGEVWGTFTCHRGEGALCLFARAEEGGRGDRDGQGPGPGSGYGTLPFRP